MEHFPPTSGDINNLILRDNHIPIVDINGSSSSRLSVDSSSSSIGSGSRSNMMDELSIDSATNEKIKIDKRQKSYAKQETLKLSLNHNNNENLKISHQKQQKKESHKSSSSSQKPHFKIEWRQLTYYQKERSYLSKLLYSENKKHCDNDTNTFLSKETTNSSSQQQEPKRILNSLDGCFRSGELSAILGPSGAGKSTFLSTLFGAKQEGAFGQTKVTWFDADQQPTVERKRSIKIASLPQNDHLLHHLTVYESLMFASKIKNATRPASGKNFHRQNVRRVAKMLKLGECLDTRCGKLSGGQYKRVSIGQELLSEPDVIILDEPTSGLDAMTCLTTVQTLKSIAMKHPISIILTIHQPDVDVFSLFDHVYVIAQGGLAIYEGPPHEIVPTLARVNLNIPSHNYNPARFIVENAFVFEPSSCGNQQDTFQALVSSPTTTTNLNITSETGLTGSSSVIGHLDEDEDEMDSEDEIEREKQTKGYLRRSVLSLTEVISGKEMLSGSGSSNKRDKKPLLNIGIQTLDGKLITSDQLARDRDRQLQLERWNLLRRLNEIQKARHRTRQDLSADELIGGDGASINAMQNSSFDTNLLGGNNTGIGDQQVLKEEFGSTSQHTSGEKSSAKSDYSSSGWSVHQHRKQTSIQDNMTSNSSTANRYRHNSGSDPPEMQTSNSTNKMSKATSLALITSSQLPLNNKNKQQTGRSLQTVNSLHGEIGSTYCSDHAGSVLSEEAEFVSVTFPNDEREQEQNSDEQPVKRMMMRRQFDKRLSAKHNCSKQRDYPIWYHAFLLTHRTWLSIVRDPIFFGIQAIMHTTIPIILALIFGSGQEEGCPRVGNFDLVDFAYSDSDNMIQGTVSSIRKSIGNIGIAFFEMFVLSFSINCITALVFPLDMYVLLKEYRNGWYSLRSYLIGRTLADLPIPVLLHALGMSILYFMTGQPHSYWRYCGIIVIVIIASLVAQSIGLTIGALLMKSSQSAVLAAAGVVAPLFALSGFIVRIHTLPTIAQVAAQGSYLYHLLNGFIILRYGFGRCQCKMEDFEQNNAHQIPSNLHTLASMWIGTYSDEYSNSQAVMASNGGSGGGQVNRTNVDPNIDVVDKMMTAFKMANSYGHQIHDCEDVLPYAMLDFNLRDHDIYGCFIVLIIMLVASRFITFAAIYYKVRSYT